MKATVLAGIVVGVLTTVPTAFPEAQGDAPFGNDKVTILGTALNMSNTATGANQTIRINIDRWSSAREREKLVTAFRTKGQAQLLHALESSPKVGFIRLPNTPERDLRYAFTSSLPGGGRRVLLATDRPIGFEEEASASRRLEYPFTLIEIRFDTQGVGVGKMAVYAKVALSSDKQSIELENYGTEPVRLTDVRIEN